MKNSLTDLPYICKLLHDTHQISVFFLNSFQEFEYEYLSSDIRNGPYYIPLKELLVVHPYQKNPEEFPIFFTKAEMNFFIIHLQENKQYLGSLIIGPSLKSEISDESIRIIMDTYKDNPNKRKLIEFYQSLPIIDQPAFLSLSLLVYYMIYHQPLDSSLVIQNNKELASFHAQIENSELELSKGRRNSIFHTNLSYERVLLDYVRKGRKDQLKEIINYSIVGEAELGLLSKRSRIRSEKNLMITGIALVCRAAIEGGLNEETAFTLSDFYIQQLEELEHINAILTLMEEAIYDFTNRVCEANQQKYSTAITICQQYIYNHLYEDITLDQLAEITHLSSNYLSSLFKKEVGQSISEYIQQQRIDEAKKLLTLTNYPITDISAWLSFNDQSYFIKIFKKFTGLTPKQYRNDKQ